MVSAGVVVGNRVSSPHVIGCRSHGADELGSARFDSAEQLLLMRIPVRSCGASTIMSPWRRMCQALPHPYGQRSANQGSTLMHARIARHFALLLAVCFLVTPVAAENWPNWRGPDGIGVSHESGLPLKWSATENVRWKVELPERGNSTPIVWGDRIFLTQPIAEENRRTLLCLDRTDGQATLAGRHHPHGSRADAPHESVLLGIASDRRRARHCLVRVGRRVLLRLGRPAALVVATSACKSTNGATPLRP